MCDCTEGKSWVTHLCNFFSEGDSSLKNQFPSEPERYCKNNYRTLANHEWFIMEFIYRLNVVMLLDMWLWTVKYYLMGMWLGSRYRDVLLLLMPSGFVGTTFPHFSPLYFVNSVVLRIAPKCFTHTSFLLSGFLIVKMYKSVPIFCLEHDDLLSNLVQNS